MLYVLDINECDSNPCGASFHFVALRSCKDLYRNGKQENAVYDIFDQSDQLYKVFCDFESDNNSVWTLITSFSLGNKRHFMTPLFNDSPRNESNPNWLDFRYFIHTCFLIG